jgi:asparagine synthase (glutamine-hydrolysing)
MPGLLGIVETTPSRHLEAMFERMIAPMQRGGRLVNETCIAVDRQWALGRVHLGILQRAPQCAQGEPVQVLFHGDLFNEAELRKQLALETPLPPDETSAAVIKALYQSHGKDFAAQLRGSFCAVILDERQKQIVLINDYLGSYPLYWYRGPKQFVFAGELKAISRYPGATFRMNPAAAADYLNFGFLFGNKTLASNVQLLPPSSTLTYFWEDGKCNLESYASIKEAFQPWQGSQAHYMEELCQSFNRAVTRCVSGDNKYLVSLSGGLDSRAILSAIDHNEPSIVTYTLGVRGCADEVIAKELSEIAKAPNQFLAMDNRYLVDGVNNIRHMVTLTDGMYLTHGLTEMLALGFLEQSDFSVLLRGHGGELAKASLAWPLHTDERIYEMQSKEEFVSYMLDRVNYISRGVSLHELFTDEWWSEMKDQARQALEESIADVSLSPPDLCSYLYLTEHHRRFTIASLELFRNYIEVRMPFVDEDFLRVLFRSPFQWRDKTDIHRAIIGINAPALMKVRNSNTGAPGDAGPFVEKLYDKMNSLFKRLNIYGYRHYHSFESWMKQRLRESVERVLLHPTSLARGILREAGVRRLIDETKRGLADHGYLLQMLLILEIWQQENDGDGGERL